LSNKPFHVYLGEIQVLLDGPARNHKKVSCDYNSCGFGIEPRGISKIRGQSITKFACRRCKSCSSRRRCVHVLRLHHNWSSDNGAARGLSNKQLQRIAVDSHLLRERQRLWRVYSREWRLWFFGTYCTPAWKRTNLPRSSYCSWSTCTTASCVERLNRGSSRWHEMNKLDIFIVASFLCTDPQFPHPQYLHVMSSKLRLTLLVVTSRTFWAG